MGASEALWPELTFRNWRETAVTLQLWTQIVGKIRLALTPWVNHSWQVPLYVTSCGLGTLPIPVGAEILEVEFDFICASAQRAHQSWCRALPGADTAADIGVLSGAHGTGLPAGCVRCERAP
jgi:hypothetical protein